MISLLNASAIQGPAEALIDKGEAGLAIYGLLFVVVVLLAFCAALLRALSGRDKLIETMIERMGNAANEQAKANQEIAVQLALNTSAVGARHLGEIPK